MRKISAPLFAALAMMLLFPVFTSAAPKAAVAPKSATAPATTSESTSIPFASMEAGVIGSGQESVMILSGTLPEGTTLPAKVRIAVPTGVTPMWMGEIADSEKGEDLVIQGTKVQGEGFDIYEATLTKFRTAQVEFSFAAPFAQNADGSYTGSISYTPADDVPQIKLGAEVPATAKLVPSAVIGDFGKGMAGQVYGQTFENVKAGAPVTVSISYNMITAPAGATAQKSKSSSTLLIVLIVGLVVAAGALIIVAANGRSASGSSQDDDGYDDDDYMPARPAQSDDNFSFDDAAFDDGAVDDGNRPSPRSTPATAKTTVKTQSNAKSKSGSEPTQDSSSKSSSKVPVIITAVIIVLGVAGAIFASSMSAKVTMVNGVYMKEFAPGDPCQKVTFELAPAAKTDLPKTADKLLKVLGESATPILRASLDSKTSILTVEFCESSTNSKAVEEILNPTGLVGDSSAVEIGVPITGADGVVTVHVTEVAPCVTDEFTIEGADASGAMFAAKLFEATKAIPSMAILSFDPKTNVASFGFCDEQASDDVVAKALEGANIKATLKSPQTKPATP